MEERKLRILELAKELFIQFGYSKVSMDMLASRLGMSKKTLYLSFDSKETLLIEIVLSFQNRLNKEMEELISNEEIEFSVKLSSMLTLVATNFSTISPHFIEDINRNAPKAWIKVQELKRDAAFHRFSMLIKEGIRMGHIKKDVNQLMAIMLYASSIDNMFNPAFLAMVPKEMAKELPHSASIIFEDIIKIIFEGILEKK